MAGFLRGLLDQYQEEMERQRNRPFLEAVMAACALVATADGHVTFSERVRVDQILETLDKLKIFDPHEGVNLFNEFRDKIIQNPKTGHENAYKAVARVATDKETGTLILRICLAVSEADGKMSMTDQIEIVSLCSRLGIDPAHCGLYIDQPPETLINPDKA